MLIPADLKYTDKDEWIRVQGTTGTIGISDYAQGQLSDVVYVGDFPSVGSQLAKGEMCAVIESVKAAADVYLPAGGKVLEVNDKLPDNPEIVNNDPYDKAWLIKIELADPSEVSGLMDAAAYEAYCQERTH